MTKELKKAIKASRRRIEKWVLKRYPDAVYLVFERELSHGFWYNYAPYIFDIEGTMLDGPYDKELVSVEDFQDRFYRKFADDIDAWLNNVSAGHGVICFAIGEKNYIECPHFVLVPGQIRTVTVSYSCWVNDTFEAGHSVAWYRHHVNVLPWAIPKEAKAYLGAEEVPGDRILNPGECLDFYVIDRARSEAHRQAA